MGRKKTLKRPAEVMETEESGSNLMPQVLCYDAPICPSLCYFFLTLSDRSKKKEKILQTTSACEPLF